jgi:YD repeat-containing protein
MSRLERVLLAIGVAGCAAAAVASETITYSYDNRGRLVKVVHNGTVNNGINTTYTYDKADDRTNRTTTGAPK